MESVHASLALYHPHVLMNCNQSWPESLQILFLNKSIPHLRQGHHKNLAVHPHSDSC